MKTLVTGGAGFIGSHLVDQLLNDGHEVIVIDNFATGRPENLGHLKSNSSLTVLDQDISNKAKIQSLFKAIDWVFHLAGLADIVPSVETPDPYYHANVTGTLNILQASKDAGVKRVVYAASSSCYGIPDRYPTPETSPIQPQYPYALTKTMGEQLVMHWQQVYQLPCNSLRLFNVYGPRSRTSGTYGAVFGVFLAQKLAGTPFTVVGDGAQTRDFVYVTDVVDAFIRAANTPKTGNIYNVGAGSPKSINHLVTLLGGAVTYIPKRPGEPECTFADITKIQDELEWEPTVSFKDGVNQMLGSIKDWKTAPVWTPESIAVANQAWFSHVR